MNKATPTIFISICLSLVGAISARAQQTPASGTDAALYYDKAVKGNAEAQFNLAICYYEGTGVDKNYTEAYAWMLKAAQQGFARAEYNLGAFLGKGIGCTQDDVESAKWYRLAAEKGNANGQYNLGMYFNQGRGEIGRAHV